MAEPSGEIKVPEDATRLAAYQAARAAEAKGGGDVVILDLRGLSDVCDYFVIAHGDTDVHVKAIAEAIEAGMAAHGRRVWHTEGGEPRSWVLLDYVDVVAHVFLDEARAYYRLEELWADAPRLGVAEVGD